MKPTKLANTFSQVLNEWLSSEEMEEVRKRNRTEQDSGICHSHDFCDANMAMEEAMKRHGIEIDIQSDSQRELWNKAWDIAKKNEFIPNEPTKPVINTYHGYELRTTLNGKAQTTLIYKDGEPMGGTFSHLDKDSSVEKAQEKIRGWLKGN